MHKVLVYSVEDGIEWAGYSDLQYSRYGYSVIPEEDYGQERHRSIYKGNICLDTLANRLVISKGHQAYLSLKQYVEEGVEKMTEEVNSIVLADFDAARPKLPPLGQKAVAEGKSEGVVWEIWTKCAGNESRFNDCMGVLRGKNNE